MFNPLTPADVVSAIGTTVRDAAKSEDRGSDFERDQLMSAYSGTRHLVVEMRSYPDALRDFATDLADRLEAEPPASLGAEPAGSADRLRGCEGSEEIGAAVATLLEELAAAGEPAAGVLADVHARLRRLADLEVDLLADGLS